MGAQIKKIYPTRKTKAEWDIPAGNPILVLISFGLLHIAFQSCSSIEFHYEIYIWNANEKRIDDVRVIYKS